MTPCTAIIPYSPPVFLGEVIRGEPAKAREDSAASERSALLAPQPPLPKLDKLVTGIIGSGDPRPSGSLNHRIAKPIKFFNFQNSFSFLLDVGVASDNRVDGDKIAEAFMSELAITRADDPRPIVATYGCGPCVAVGGYDPTNKIAFVVHFTNEREVSKYGDLIFCNIVRLTKKPIRSPIQIHLRGGFKGISESTIKAIKVWVKQNDLPMEIVSEDVLGGGVEAKSLSIDSRTGEVSEYDVKANDKARSFSELDAELAMMSAYDPKITLAYAPK